jgi:hypothetical protein
MERTAQTRFKKDIRIKPETVQARPRLRTCARPECANEGTHPVPKSKDNLNEHLWFCLEHARAHNESWDYFAGMSDVEIETFRDAAVIGHRPTWPLGKRAARPRNGHAPHNFEDGFEVFSREGPFERPRPPERRITDIQARALNVLNLDASATLHQIKARYKELVKRFHPDANGGDRGAEERLKQVIRAYGVLRASGLT